MYSSEVVYFFYFFFLSVSLGCKHEIVMFIFLFLKCSKKKSLRNFKRRIDKWLSVSDSHTADM